MQSKTRSHTTPFRIAASLLFALVASLSGAAPAAKDACAGSANETALLRCRQARLTNSDSALKAVIRRLDRTASKDEPGWAKALSASQVAWLTYREAECRLRTYDSRDGTAFEAYWLACLNELNLGRLRDLRLLNDQP